MVAMLFKLAQVHIHAFQAINEEHLVPQLDHASIQSGYSKNPIERLD
jgi:hypothetical protein